MGDLAPDANTSLSSKGWWPAGLRAPGDLQERQEIHADSYLLRNSAGERRWCTVPFRRPLPLYNLDWLASRNEATVVMVEGEKAADAAGRLLPAAVSTTWPGGSKAYLH